MDLIYRYDPCLPVEIESATDSAAAMKILCDGNRRLATVVARMQRAALGEKSEEAIVVPVCPGSLGLPMSSGAVATQRPYAIVLGCSNAHVPVEPIFDQSFNDLFVIRIAGNVLGTECLGSVDFAVRHFADSLKLIVVLGHTGCGAVSAAVETYLSPKDYADIAYTHALRSLLDRMMISVRGAANAIQHVCGPSVVQHPNYKQGLKEVAVYLNAAITALDLRREIAVFGTDSLHVVYGVYDLATLFVSPLPHAAPTDPGFAPAPQPDQLVELAKNLVQAVIGKGVFGAGKDV